MSRTRRGSKGAGYEYWSRRLDGYCHEPGRWTKKRTVRGERRAGKKECRQWS